MHEAMAQYSGVHVWLCVLSLGVLAGAPAVVGAGTSAGSVLVTAASALRLHDRDGRGAVTG